VKCTYFEAALGQRETQMATSYLGLPDEEVDFKALALHAHLQLVGPLWDEQNHRAPPSTK